MFFLPKKILLLRIIITNYYNIEFLRIANFCFEIVIKWLNGYNISLQVDPNLSLHFSSPNLWVVSILVLSNRTRADTLISL